MWISAQMEEVNIAGTEYKCTPVNMDNVLTFEKNTKTEHYSETEYYTIDFIGFDSIIISWVYANKQIRDENYKDIMKVLE